MTHHPQNQDNLQTYKIVVVGDGGGNTFFENKFKKLKMR